MTTKAFTLSEILITLGIIGVIAMLTLPTLITNFQDQILISQAKRSYAEIFNALELAKSDINAQDYTEVFRPARRGTAETEDLENFQSSDYVLNLLLKHLEVEKFCGYEASGCYSNQVKNDTKENDGFNRISVHNMDHESFSRAILKDGTTIALRNYQSGDYKCLNRFPDYKKDSNGNYLDENDNPILDGNNNKRVLIKEDLSYQCGQIVFDVNGLKGPNQFGRDNFSFIITPTGNYSYKGNYYNTVQKGKLEYYKFNIGDKYDPSMD